MQSDDEAPPRRQMRESELELEDTDEEKEMEEVSK